jgi:hypothetical protein
LRKASLLLPAALSVVLLSLVLTSGCGESAESSSQGSGGSGGSASPNDGGGAGAPETPADVAGDYTVTLISHANDCPAMSLQWMEGAVSKDVPFSITQEGTELEAETMGAPAIAFLLLTGSVEFAGEIQGSHFVLTNTGTKPYTYDACTYTINATVEGDVDGDVIVGTLVYAPVISMDPACRDYACRAEQAFTGTRPAK